MKKIFFIVTLFITIDTFSQTDINKFLDSTLTELKALSPVDKSDLKVYSLLDTFYEEALQSNQGNITPATAGKVKACLNDVTTKNRHLLVLFLIYQEHVGQAAAERERPNSEFQIASIQLLEKEFEKVYGKVPVIVYIYKAEALGGAGGRDKEANAVVEAGLKKYPNSIPLKVYKYLNTFDESVKKDLVANHSGHWMVQQFGIR